MGLCRINKNRIAGDVNELRLRLHAAPRAIEPQLP